ncbi:Transposase DDE domain protein [uncultured archaeon]|nr:Transposase DDE domain protein [uncultured archaeon]
MEPTRRIKKKNGIEYWYEETPYYDTEKKQIRHHSKYLGRNINGQPVRMRSAPAEVKEMTKKKSASIKSSFDYGPILVLQSIMNELNIDRYLSALLPPSEVSMVRALAFNRIIRPTAMKNVSSWYEGTALALESPQINLSSQRVSELLCRLGESNVPDMFMSQLIEGTGTKNTLIYDITSLSSYSQLINLLEYGYNRDGESLPQINLSLILDKDKGIPVMYDIFPGSISDVSTLSGTLKKIKAHGIENYVAVMDRGFFSLSNLRELMSNKISFIMAARLQLNDLKQLLTEAQKDIDDVKYLHKFNKDPIFAKPITYTIDSIEVHGYVYYDPKLEQTEKQSLLSRLYDIREELLKVHLNKNSNPCAVFKDKAKGFGNFFDWHVIENRFDVAIKQNAVAQRMNKMGKYIIFYSGDFDWMKCLSLYRERDEIEKSFKMLKSEIDILPLNTHSEETTRGFIFIAFLSLIIRSRLINMMRNAEILDKYSIELMLLQLEKLKKIALADGTIFVTEMTKTHKEILQALNLCA